MNHYFCYWSNEEYRELALGCRDSFQRHGLAVHVRSLANHGKWMLNCMARAHALQQEAAAFPGGGVGLLDADLTCYKPPYRLFSFEGDVAVHDKTMDRPPSPQLCPNSRYSAGVLCFAPTTLGRECLARWASLCALDQNKGEILREQYYLEQAIKEGLTRGLAVCNLGREYNCPVDSSTVILHHVESRRSRDKIGGGM